MAYTPPTPYAPLSGQLTYGSGLQLVDEVLTNVAKQFAPKGHLYERICQGFPVNHRFGRYPVFDPSTFFSTGGKLEVADLAQTPILDFNWSHDNFAAQVRRAQTIVTQEEALQAHPGLRLDYSKTRGLLTVFANNREARLAAQLRATANGGQITNAAITPSVKWDAGTSGTPATIQQDIQNGLLVAMKACGIRPNTIVMDYEIALAIANDVTLKAQLQYRIGEQIFTNQLADSLAGNNGGGVLPAKLFGLNVLVADGTLQNAARPGQAMSVSGIWGQSVRLVYIPDGPPQWGVPATAYSFKAPVSNVSHQPPQTIMPSGGSGQEPGATGDWALVDRWWDYDPPAEHIRVRECVDERIVAPELGVELSSVLTPTASEY